MKKATKFILDRRFPVVMRKIVAAMRPWPWCMIGGRAVEVWANPPQTPDVDVLAAVTDEDVPNVLRSFARHGVRRDEVNAGLGSPIVFLTDTRTRVEVDVLGAYDPLHFEVIARAAKRTVQAVRFKVAYAEDVMMLKAQAATDMGRPAPKRARDRKAIFDLAKAAGKRLDRNHIRTALASHGWTDEAALLKFMRVI